MVNIAYGVCVGSQEKLSRNVSPRVSDRTLLAVPGGDSIASVYNEILDTCQKQGVDALVLLHDDLEILDPDAEEKFLNVINEDSEVMLVGVAGGSARQGLAWWNADPVGHQRTDVMDIDFGPRVGDVDLLEGSILVFSPEAIRRLRFDTRFPGFHGYDEIGMQANMLGRVTVTDVDTHHHSHMGFKSGQSYADWLSADQLFREKWQL